MKSAVTGFNNIYVEIVLYFIQKNVWSICKCKCFWHVSVVLLKKKRFIANMTSFLRDFRNTLNSVLEIQLKTRNC